MSEVCQHAGCFNPRDQKDSGLCAECRAATRLVKALNATAPSSAATDFASEKVRPSKHRCAHCGADIPPSNEFWWGDLPYCNNTCRLAKATVGDASPSAPLPAGLAKPIQAADDPRHKQHGTFQLRSAIAQEIKQTLRFGKERWACLDSDQRQALDEIAGKISRICCGDPNDPEHWDDIAGYAKLVADRLKGVVR